ncbi:hypothetical protein HELRODRAFT_188121 [Helobdella robusta]|uniref:Ig-like domain-containing protein n=1 Tax=Helobdella robusta TaxID=6412 RepID=T1FPN8_HELRO|nr:hypothetical protein HELRODRAFT_188121 [Helobdella robusta]ESO13126.1 hypothetical protein HELRODRAFT_188121 [Helobdella robusta]
MKERMNEFLHSGPIQPPIIKSRHPAFDYANDMKEKADTCVAIGTPPIHYYWESEKSGQKIPGPTLNFSKHFSRSEEGNYYCVATNAFGVAQSNVTKYIFQKASCSSSSVPNNIFLLEGFSYQLPCGVECIPEGTCEIQWKWLSGYIPFTPRTDMRFDPFSGTMHINYVDSSIRDLLSGKTLICSGKAGVTTVECASHTFTYSSDHRPKTTPTELKFNTEPNLLALLGDSITLDCFFVTRDRCTVAWEMKSSDGDWRPVKFSEAFFNSPDSLTISSVKFSHAGQYRCKCGEEGVHEKNLTVRARPYFKSVDDMPVSKQYVEGDDAVINCRPLGVPEPTVEWFFDSTPYKKYIETHPKVWLSDDGRQLNYRQLCRSRCTNKPKGDNIVITCVVSNVHATYRYSAAISVYDRTVITKAPENRSVSVTNKYTTSVVFDCAAQNDIYTNITYYWFFRPANQDFFHLLNSTDYAVSNGRVHSDQLEIRVMNSTDWPAHAGDYKCKATNNITFDEKVATLLVNESSPTAGPSKKADAFSWIIILAVCAIILVLILCIIVVWCCYYNRGAEYKVDKKERKSGNKPEEELERTAFQNYQRPSTNPLKSSRMSLDTSMQMDSDDEGSLNDYGDIDHPGKFGEDGSFIGQYNTSTRNNNTHNVSGTASGQPYTGTVGRGGTNAGYPYGTNGYGQNNFPRI